jgi:hypothetical protein
MGDVHSPPRVLLLAAVFSRHATAIDWARARLAETWGPITLESPRFAFAETDYYQATMGPELRKCFLAVDCAFDAAELAATKLLTNRWEEEYARMAGHAEPRPLNIDPGYLTLGKLVLASTKDFAHRIYLQQGIYAEVTLYYRHHAWQHHQFTFADYRRADYQAFFSECRDWLHGQLREAEKGTTKTQRHEGEEQKGPRMNTDEHG